MQRLVVFSSPVFLFLFLPLLLGIYYLPKGGSRRHRNAVLLVASILFYAWGEPIFVFAMLAAIWLNWVLARPLPTAGRRARAALLAVAVTCDVCLLLSVKYLPAIARAVLPGSLVTRVLGRVGLPIGVSFFTCQLISYVVDVYRGDAKPGTLAECALYVALFPQLVAGPIVRYQDIASQLAVREESLAAVAQGMRRLSVGLGKKVLIANYLAQIADVTFASLDAPSVGMAWFGLLCYALQIYYDFSGYSDMAIGRARMFGFTLRENFDHPYLASSCADFWRRWHISLSTWFRDYVYIPLGGSRRGHARTILNLVVVWLLTGAWHGASLTFVAWGLIWCVACVAERELGRSRVDTPVSHALTLLVALVGYVLFRSPSIASAVTYLGWLVGVGADGLVGPYLSYAIAEAGALVAVGAIGSTTVPVAVGEWLCRHRAGWAVALGQVSVFVLVCAVLATSSYQPFIYFNF